MPRVLPWQKGSSSSTTVSRTKRPGAVVSASAKRPKIEKSANQSDTEEASSPRKSELENHGRAPSTSPPPEPPKEIMMHEGLDNDDRFRMVEDEFLSVAQRFTVHLHAAEYKRQQRLVRARNAEAIISISRPVTGKMPDHTKRKAESVNRSITQRSALKGLLGKNCQVKPGPEDSDDDEGLPYTGTTLHGLMDSPQRKAASLLKAGPIVATTRAAAGFKKPLKHGLGSSTPKKPLLNAMVFKYSDDSSTESSPDEDDLDLPIPASKLTTSAIKPISKEKTLSNSRPGSSLLEPPIKSEVKQITISREPTLRQGPVSQTTSEAKLPNPNSAAPRPSRLDYARRQKAKQEAEQKKDRGVIPTFL